MQQAMSILFVDDDPALLNALRRALRQQSRDWQLSFAQSAGEALAQMKKQAFDLVVSDLRLSDMTGVALLRRVARLRPTSLRVVLSGHATQRNALEAAGVAHLYLTKPYETEDLVAVIQRAEVLREMQLDEQSRARLGQLSELPVLPSVYERLTALLREMGDEVGISDVAEVVSSDPALVAKLLQLTNSAFFGLARSVETVEQAVTALGLDTLRALVLAIGLFKPDEREQISPEVHQALLQHSCEVAALAKRFARRSKAGRQQQEQVFLAGILHDVGLLPLLANGQIDESEWTDHDSDQPADSQRNHALIGAYLLRLWGFADGLVELVQYHHQPLPYRSDMLDWVALAEVRARGVTEPARGWLAKRDDLKEMLNDA
ncbi:HDOD domain-containing protein [Marinobacterium arenosum]|uniref:HDOD domain-containing protein n=1 Tax=Marinobacterium arenosum TaxID=2862496 RepID=UPI001C988BDB|nr:HDOD domain-containing protein [Marinobacterium arenosum]MBY4675448.1 HDOD domain-containing protein [Marinobacterium arenosum]